MQEDIGDLSGNNTRIKLHAYIVSKFYMCETLYRVLTLCLYSGVIVLVFLWKDGFDWEVCHMQ